MALQKDGWLDIVEFIGPSGTTGAPKKAAQQEKRQYFQRSGIVFGCPSPNFWLLGYEKKHKIYFRKYELTKDMGQGIQEWTKSNLWKTTSA